MAITDTLVATPPPLRLDEGGTLRVGKTRVTLDTVIHAYQDGATAEEIAEAFDTLDLADIHGVISYYLRHQNEVQTYLDQRRQEADELRRFWQARCPPDGLKERLLERRRQQLEQQEPR